MQDGLFFFLHEARGVQQTGRTGKRGVNFRCFHLTFGLLLHSRAAAGGLAGKPLRECLKPTTPPLSPLLTD